RVAVKARARRRPARQGRTPEVPAADPFDEIDARELRRVLDEEVSRLPAKYRAAVVLCLLEGRPYAEAARLLECSKAAIALRLARARDVLRRRLTRRGVVLSVGLLLTLEVGRWAPAPVPKALAQAAVRAARSAAPAGTLVPAVDGPAAVAASAASWV